VRIKLAPMSRLIPQEMAKNGTAAEMSRMVVGGLKAYYSTGRGSQGITKLAGPKEMFAQSPNLVEARALFEANRSITVCLHSGWISSKRKHSVK
jgi:hypothetical protein